MKNFITPITPITLITLITLLAPTFLFSQSSFEIQGHRGCRGLMPENTVKAFLKAIEVGATTLEMDVVITRDQQVVVSHEPYMSHLTCLDRHGNEIEKENEKKLRIYDMNLDQVQQFDCGSKPNPNFPEQQKVKTHKPTLREVFQTVEDYLTENQITRVNYNIETKCSLDGDNISHPEPEKFVELLMSVINEYGLASRVTIQSFDVRTLQYLHQVYPEIKTSLLVANLKSPNKNIKKLGFKPDFYSPNYILVSKKMVKQLHHKNIMVIPWTVNKESDMQKMIGLGVDGIISDYPDRLALIARYAY